MSNFTKVVTNTYPFDGDTVEVTQKRLSRKDALTLMPFMKMSDSGAVTMSFKDQQELLNSASDIVKGNVTEIKGLFIDGVEAKVGTEDFDVVFNDVYFMQLVSLIVRDSISQSFLKVDDEKKFEVVQEKSLAGSDTFPNLKSEV